MQISEGVATIDATAALITRAQVRALGSGEGSGWDRRLGFHYRVPMAILLISDCAAEGIGMGRGLKYRPNSS